VAGSSRQASPSGIQRWGLALTLIPPFDDLKDWYVWQWIKKHG
jgi:hypothetical protein